MNMSELLNKATNGNLSIKEIINMAYELGKGNTAVGEYKIIRTYSAGVFFGILESRNGKEGVIRNARRLWYWDGAASLSQLAMEGVSKPENCKFPTSVGRIEVTEIVEVLDVTEKAKKSIDAVPVWSA